MKEYISGIQHIGLPTGKIEDTIAFYESLGFERSFETALELETRKQRVCFLKQSNIVIEVYEEETAGEPGAIDHFAIDVKDIEEAFFDIKDLGYECLEGEIKSLPFWKNGVKFFTIMGPNGEKVEFSQIL